MDSILLSIKKLLGIHENCTDFDVDLIIHINSVLMILGQIGVGSNPTFSITGATETWSDYIPEGFNLECIKTYVYLKVRLLFDPPSNSFVTESINKMIAEYEWRIMVETEGFFKGEN